MAGFCTRRFGALRDGRKLAYPRRQRRAHRSLDCRADGPPSSAKRHLGLGRVHVHVYDVGRDLDEDERQEPLVARARSGTPPMHRPSTAARSRTPRRLTNSRRSGRAGRGRSGLDTNPAPRPTRCRPRPAGGPRSGASTRTAGRPRAARPSTGGASTRARPRAQENPVRGRARPRTVTASATCDASVAAERRNLRRAGTAPNRSRTSTVCPLGCPASLTGTAGRG